MMPMRPVATRANLSAASIASAPEFPNEIRVKGGGDRKSTRLNSSHSQISYAVFCLKKKKVRVGHHARRRQLVDAPEVRLRPGTVGYGGRLRVPVFLRRARGTRAMLRG